MMDSIIGGVLVGAAIPLLKDWLSSLRAEKLERIKLHDTQRLKAYQTANKFLSSLKLSLQDKTQAGDLAFLNGSAAELYSAIDNLPYYSKSVKSSLIELDGVMEHVRSNILDKEANVNLINEKVRPISERLRNEILCDLKVWEL